jgi:hypothetical protein
VHHRCYDGDPNETPNFSRAFDKLRNIYVAT